ncbi:MAG: T9SS type A sorting domain-containing protein [Saprospirales bacterium]|nr:T9SS type A sorting domain-containing protein [Saprospirales bacterium]
MFICDGSAILKASSVTPPSSSLNWTNISGSGSSSASGNPVTITGLTAGTSIYQLKATNGQCIDIPIGKDTIVIPTTVPSTVSTTNSCNLCIYSDGTTKTFYNSTDGKIIGTIQDDAAVTPAELGETEMCLDIAGSVPSVVDNFGLNQPYLQRRWTIKPTTNTNSIITLYFTTAELTALQAAANTTRYQFSGYDLYVTKFDGGGNGTFTPPCTGGTGGCGMVTGRSVPAVFGAYNGDHFVSFTINSFSTFYVHPALFPFAPLPVELISFNGWNAGAVNQLQWKTASEKNTAKFIVEKSIDGVTYTSIGEQTAAGNSTTTLSYSLSDNQPVIGNNYYRLKTVDIDGKFSYSDVINIPVNEAYTNSFTRVYPNPTKGNLNVEIQSSTTSNTKIVVFDVVGKKIFEKETSLVKGINTLTFDVADYADGAYILQFIDSTGKTHTTKFVKK